MKRADFQSRGAVVSVGAYMTSFMAILHTTASSRLPHVSS